MRRVGGVLRAVVSAARSFPGSLHSFAAAGAVGASQLRCLQSSDGPKAPPTPQVGRIDDAQASVCNDALDGQMLYLSTLLHIDTQPGRHAASAVQHGWHQGSNFSSC